MAILNGRTITFSPEIIDGEHYYNKTEIDTKLNNMGYLFSEVGAINISNSTLTTLKEYFDLFCIDTTKNYLCGIGNATTNNFKTLVGTPSGMGNYVDCHIKLYDVGAYNSKTFQIFAYDAYGTRIAIGYIFANADLPYVITFTGWTVY